MQFKIESLIHGRKLELCPTLAADPISEVFHVCDDCDCFLLHCCACSNANYERQSKGLPLRKSCHHFRIVFTDGACTNNGRPDARAGMGAAYGMKEETQFHVGITDEEDEGLRTSQRAELLAATMGLSLMAEADRLNRKEGDKSMKTWIIATDSDYVVKGITQWLPTWKKNRFRTAKGTTPANLDLFVALDQELTRHEERNVQIGFWHVPREHNQLANSLAKKAALDGHIASILEGQHDSQVPLEGAKKRRRR